MTAEATSSVNAETPSAETPVPGPLTLTEIAVEKVLTA